MKTENANEVGRHAFETAGLGIAPFRFVGTSENVIVHPDGTQQAGGTCDYCYTGIRLECQVVSADGKRFKVGCNCIAKVGDAGLLKAYKQSPEFRAYQRKLRALRDAAVSKELEQILATHGDCFATFPHPYKFTDRETGMPLTYLDYVNYSLRSCGAAGRLSWVKHLRNKTTDSPNGQII